MGFQVVVMFIDSFMDDVTYVKDITKDVFKYITVMLLIKWRLLQKCCSIFHLMNLCINIIMSNTVVSLH
jgi:hypothetical protein